MAIFKPDFVELNLSSDELMLKELERRDGIYSFIFHELEMPKEDKPTPSISPAQIIRDSTYIKTTTEDETSANTNADSFSFKIKSEFISIQCVDTVGTLTNAAATTKTLKLPSFTPTSYVNTLQSVKCSSTATAATKAGATATIVRSLLASTPVATTPATTATTAAMNGISATLPRIPSRCRCPSRSRASYHEYLKTWQPPPTLVFDNPKPFACAADCSFRVRMSTPRFPHISLPLVRNRRHALKETPQYKRMSKSRKCAPVADLRALFPFDPDVHAPFATTVELVAAKTPVDVSSAVGLSYGCCGNGSVPLLVRSTALK